MGKKGKIRNYLIAGALDVGSVLLLGDTLSFVGATYDHYHPTKKTSNASSTTKTSASNTKATSSKTAGTSASKTEKKTAGTKNTATQNYELWTPSVFDDGPKKNTKKKTKKSTAKTTKKSDDEDWEWDSILLE